MTFDADKLRALDGAATGGTWIAAPYSSVVGAPIVSSPSGRSIGKVTYFDLGGEFEHHDRESKANADLIVHLRNSVPAILAMAEERDRSEKHRNDLADKITEQSIEIGALKAENKRLREALEGLRGDGSASGTWAEAVEPLIARFNVAAQFGADAVHNGEGAKAIAALLQSMAERLDRACSIARRALGKDKA